VPHKLWHVVTQLGHTNWVTFSVGVGAIAMLFVLPRLSKRLPAGLLVLALAIALSSALDLSSAHGVDVVGVLPKGLPGFASFHIRLSQLWTVIPAAVGIVLVALSEALGVADTFANRHGYEIDANQEMFAYGAANAASGVLGGLVACGGMSSTAVNEGAGAKTEVSGLVTTAMVFITVIALTPLFKNLPEAVLAALIIHAVSHMMRVGKLRAVYRVAPAEFWLGLTALFGVVMFDVLQGLVIAMVASMLLVVYRSSKPSVAAQGELTDAPGQFGAIERHPDATTWPGVLVVDHEAPIYYANAVANRDATKLLVNSADPPITTVVYLMEGLHRLDVTSIESFEQLSDWFTTHDVEVFIVRPHKDLMELAERAGLRKLVDDEHIVAGVDEALRLRRHR
jgi:MFS superfamily sulfate permease-like transporter